MPDTGFDINRYGIALQLTIETDEAAGKLDKLEDQLTRLEQRVVQATKVALAEFKTTTMDITAQVSELNDHYSDIFKLIDDSIPQYKKIEEFYEKEKVFLEEKHDLLLEAGKQFDGFTKQYADAQKALIAEGTGLKGIEDYLGLIIDKLKIKNTLLVDELELLGKDAEAVAKLRTALDTVTSSARQGRDAFGQMSGALQQVWMWMKAVVNEETERFHTANYRWIGDMKDIVQSVSNVSVAYTITREQAMEAYRAFGNTRYPRDELEHLAGTLGRLNRITGMNIGVMASYGLKLRMAGAEAGKIEDHLNTMAEAMRKSGISTETMEDILKDTEYDAQQLMRRFTDKDAKLNMDAIQASLIGIGKQAGMSEESLVAINKAMLNSAMHSKTTLVMEALLGRKIQDTGDMREATLKTAALFYEKLNGLAGEEFEIHAAAWGKEMGIADTKIISNMMHMHELDRAGQLTTETWKKLAKEMDVASAADRDRAKVYTKSTENAFYQLKMVGEQALNIWRQLQYYLEGPVWVLAGALQWALWLLNKILSIVTAIVVKMDEWVGILTGGWAAGFFKTMTGGLILWLVLGTRIGPMIWGWASGLRGVGAAATWVGGRFTAMTGMFTGLIQGIGRVVGAITTAIGEAIANLVRPLVGLAGPLLALSASVLMVGAGMYLMAQAASVMAEKGWAAVGALAALAVVVAVLIGAGVALAAFAPVALTAAAGLAPLVITFTAVGAAAVLMGFGVKLAVDALAGLIKTVSESAAPMTTVTMVIGKLGVALAKMAWDIGLLGAARLVAIGVAVRQLGGGMRALGTGLEQTIGALQTFGADSEAFTQNIRQLTDALGQLDSGRIERAATGLRNLSTALQQAMAPLVAAVEPLVKLGGAITAIADKAITAADQLRVLGIALQEFVVAARAVVDIAPQFANAVIMIVTALELVGRGLADNLKAVAVALTVFSEPEVIGAAGSVLIVGQSFQLLSEAATIELAATLYDIADALYAIEDAAERAGIPLERVVLAFAMMSPNVLTGMVKGFTTMNLRMGTALRSTYRLGDQYRDIRRSVGGLRTEFTALAGAGNKFGASNVVMDKFSETMARFQDKFKDNKKATDAGKSWMDSIRTGMVSGWEATKKWFDEIDINTAMRKSVGAAGADQMKGVADAAAKAKEALGAESKATNENTQATQDRKAALKQLSQQMGQSIRDGLAQQAAQEAALKQLSQRMGQSIRDSLAQQTAQEAALKQLSQQMGQSIRDSLAQQVAQKAGAQGAKQAADEQIKLANAVKLAGQAQQSTAKIADAAAAPLSKVQLVEQQMMKVREQYHRQHGENIRRQLKMQYNRMATDRLAMVAEAQPPMTEIQRAQFRVMQIQQRTMYAHGATARRLLRHQYRDAVQHYQDMSQQARQATAPIDQLNRTAVRSATAASKVAAQTRMGSNHLEQIGEKFYIVVDAHKKMHKALTEHNLANPLEKDAKAVEITYGALDKQAGAAASNIIEHNDRIVTAINRKAIPAMQQAKDKLGEQMRAETIATVQVAQNREGSRTTDHQQEQNRLIGLIHGYLAANQKNNPIADILDLLQTHLPGIAKDDMGSSHGLTSNLNNWGA